MNFRFKEKVSARNHVMATVMCLQEFPIEDVLTAPWLFTEWKPDVIADVLTYLKPENVRVHVIGQKFENIATETESWYGTKYKKEAIPPETIENWKNSGLNESLSLPDKNEFIPTNFDTKLNSSEPVSKFFSRKTLFIHLTHLLMT